MPACTRLSAVLGLPKQLALLYPLYTSQECEGKDRERMKEEREKRALRCEGKGEGRRERSVRVEGREEDGRRASGAKTSKED
jgi:hypothetical protein